MPPKLLHLDLEMKRRRNNEHRMALPLTRMLLLVRLLLGILTMTINIPINHSMPLTP